MERKILLCACLLFIFSIAAMHNKIFEPFSLKLIAALKVTDLEFTITEKEAPQEILELIDIINTIKASYGCSANKKMLFISLLDNPTLDIEKYFPYIIKRCLKNQKFVDKIDLLNAMLWQAVEESNTLLVKILIYLGANTNARDKNDETVLILAVNNGDKKIVKLLIKYGAQINAQDKFGCTALRWAVQKQNKEIVKVLLKNNADVKIQDIYTITPLISTILSNNKEIAKMLLDKNANFDEYILNLPVDKEMSQILQSYGAKKFNYKD